MRIFAATHIYYKVWCRIILSIIEKKLKVLLMEYCFLYYICIMKF